MNTRVHDDPPDWKLYERLAAFVESMSSDPSLTVHPNVKLMGQFSGVERQIDVLIDCRLNEDRSKRVVLDAKLRTRPLDVKDIEEFEGMMVDVRADRGILVCPNGFSPAAERRARKAITIKLLDPEDLDSVDLSTWDTCASEICWHRTTGRGRYSGWVLYDEVFHVGALDEPVSAVGIGKCDLCSCFNVWCWECGEKFALEGDEADNQCACERFWVTSVESEGQLDDGTELKSVCLTVGFVCHDLPAIATVGRRPLN